MATVLVYDKLDGGFQYHYSRVTSIAEGIVIRSRRLYLFNNSFAVVTGYTLNTGDNVSINSTLGNTLYAYVLGFQPYTLALSGILYNNPDSPLPVQQFMMDFTRARAFNNNQLVQVALGNVCFKALLTDFHIYSTITEATHSTTFTLTLRGIA